MILILKHISGAMWKLQTVNTNSDWEIGRKHITKRIWQTQELINSPTTTVI